MQVNVTPQIHEAIRADALPGIDGLAGTDSPAAHRHVSLQDDLRHTFFLIALYSAMKKMSGKEPHFVDDDPCEGLSDAAAPGRR